MRAAVYHSFGGPDVVHVEDVPTPSPQAGQVRIRIHATTASMADYRMRTRDLPEGLGFLAPIMLGIFSPRHKVLGMDLAGTVDAVGPGIVRWKVGDEVIAMPGSNFGGHAEFICLPESGAIAFKPQNWSFEDSVTLVFGGGTIAAYLPRLDIGPGTTVLVNGASSATGTAAVQLAKYLGATVTGVSSGGNADLVRSLGAEQMIDYTTQNFTEMPNRYDVVFDCVGNHPFEQLLSVLAPGGTLVPVVTTLRTMLSASGAAKKQGKRVIPSAVTPGAGSLALLVELADAGAFRPVIDRTYEFDEIAEAHRYLDTGRKRGNIVVRLS